MKMVVLDESSCELNSCAFSLTPIPNAYEILHARDALTRNVVPDISTILTREALRKLAPHDGSSIPRLQSHDHTPR